MSEFNLIMETWRGYLHEEAQDRTWGQLAADILAAKTAQKWPKFGKTLLRLGIKAASGAIKGIVDGVQEMEELMDWIPDNIQAKIEAGSEAGVEWIQNVSREKGGPIVKYLIDDVMGADDRLTKNLAGFEQLNMNDAYEKLVNKELLKKFAIEMMRKAQTAPADEKIPDFDAEFEKMTQQGLGVHPDADEPDIKQD